MKFNIKHIIEGIKNSVFVREEVEKIARERYKICQACPKNSINYKLYLAEDEDKDSEMGPYYSSLRPDEHCSMCACNIHAKTRSLHTNCPIDKWQAVATKEEAAKIAAAIDQQTS